MRQRNTYGLAGTATLTSAPRPAPGTRRPVTERGRIALENSRRRISQR
jgi:hypothetical protein